MASSASIWGRRIQEFAGAKKTNDPDVDACVAKLTHLERDVLLLRKTLESSALVLSTTLPRARAGMTELMVSLGEFVSRGQGKLQKYFSHYRNLFICLP